MTKKCISTVLGGASSGKWVLPGSGRPNEGVASRPEQHGGQTRGAWSPAADTATPIGPVRRSRFGNCGCVAPALMSSAAGVTDDDSGCERAGGAQ